jgi:hypothetical protein
LLKVYLQPMLLLLVVTTASAIAFEAELTYKGDYSPHRLPRKVR